MTQHTYDLRVRCHNGFQPCRFTGGESVRGDEAIVELQFMNKSVMWIPKKDYDSRPNYFVKGEWH